MYAKIKIDGPDEVKATMAISMRMADWKKVKAALDVSENSLAYPVSTLRLNIGALVDAMERVIVSPVKETS